MSNKIYVAIKKSRCFIEATVRKIKKPMIMTDPFIDLNKNF